MCKEIGIHKCDVRFKFGYHIFLFRGHCDLSCMLDVGPIGETCGDFKKRKKKSLLIQVIYFAYDKFNISIWKFCNTIKVKHFKRK